MPANFVELAIEAEKAGYDAVWTVDSWSDERSSPLVALAENTRRIRLGTGMVAISGQSPAIPGVDALGSDRIDGSDRAGILNRATAGRLIVGLDVSDLHQEVETLGPPASVESARRGGEIPVWVGAEGPERVEEVCAVADGWFPPFYSPWRAEIFHDQIKDRRKGFAICVATSLMVHSDVEEALWGTRVALASYAARADTAGVGADRQDHRLRLMAGMGIEEHVPLIRKLFLEGDRVGAAGAVPTEVADEISLVGSVDRIRDRVQAWEESAVTMLNVAPCTVAEVWEIAELVKGR